MTSQPCATATIAEPPVLPVTAPPTDYGVLFVIIPAVLGLVFMFALGLVAIGGGGESTFSN